jgi:hypothetical protein
MRRYVAEHKLTQKQVAQELGRPEDWVSDRLALALIIIEEVRKGINRSSDYHVADSHNLAAFAKRRQIDTLSHKSTETFPPNSSRRAGEAEKEALGGQTKQLVRFFQKDTLCVIEYGGIDFARFSKTFQEHEANFSVDIWESEET